MIELVWWDLHKAYFLEMGLTQIKAYHENILIIRHVNTQVGFSYVMISLGP